MLVCVHGKDGEGLYGEPSRGAAGSGAATDVAAGGAADVAAGAVGVAASGAAAGAVGVAAGGAAGGAVGVTAGGAAGVAAVGVAAGGGAGGANGAVAGDDTVPVASVALDGSDCDELTSANRCCSIIQIKIELGAGSPLIHGEGVKDSLYALVRTDDGRSVVGIQGDHRQGG